MNILPYRPIPAASIVSAANHLMWAVSDGCIQHAIGIAAPNNNTNTVG